MTHDDAIKLADEISEATIREKYSGRGMYGSTTTGVVVPYLEEAENIAEELDLDYRATDNMGKNYIIY